MALSLLFWIKNAIVCQIVGWSCQPERGAFYISFRRPASPLNLTALKLQLATKMYASLPEDMPLERQMSNVGASMANQPWPDETLGE